MQSFIGVSQLLAVLLVQLTPVQNSHPPVEVHSKVILFQEVWRRSLCRSIERLVEVEQEYPGEVEHIFSPACVPLWRCSGCCGDDNLECHPTLTSNTTMQLLRISPSERSGHYVELTFVEHRECECRPRRTHLNNESRSQSIKNRPSRPRRRKHRKRAKDCGNTACDIDRELSSVEETSFKLA